MNKTIDEKYVVDGYVFSTEAEYKDALNEKKGVDYMKSRTNMNNVQNVKEVYEKVLEKNIFKTQIGYNFMRELQEVLMKSSLVSAEEIKNIPVEGREDKRTLETNKQLRERIKNIEADYKNKFFNSIFLNVALIIMIIVIIVITMNSKNTNILNYKNRLDAEYTSKEDDLAEWEEELEEREKMLESEE